MLKKILHTGTAVPDLQSAIKLYKSLGFEVTKEFHKPDINADVAMASKDDTVFELFYFKNIDHPYVKFISSHIAIYSDNLEEDINYLLGKDYKITIPITEGIIYRFAFLQDSSGTNYEIATDKTGH